MSHVWRHRQAAHYTRGRPAPPTLIVIHCTEGATAAGAASWFANPASAGSAHLVVDDQEVWRCVDDADTAWHAKGVNSIGLGLEITGFARWTEDEWMQHEPRLIEAARIHAGWSRAYGIPLTRSETRGYHPHAGLPGNDHTDPGAGFPWDFYLSQVRRWLDTPVEAGPRPYGRSLRLVRGRPGEKRHARWGGWTEQEVPAGWDGPALGPLENLARGRGPVTEPFVLTWRGGTFNDPTTIRRVARTILSRTEE